MKWRNPLWRVFIICGLFAIAAGCAGTRRKHVEFIQTNTQSIRVGMTQQEVELLFGPPDIVYEMEFGAKTDREWDGLVYTYLPEKDPKYEYGDRRLTNTFVFYIGEGGPVLNHWSIEHTYD